MGLYSTIFRRLLFRLDAEVAHGATIEACRLAGSLPWVPTLINRCMRYEAPELEIEVAGLRFANPIGLGAGWDKNAKALRVLDQLGFGFVEIGSISARASIGNPKPRLFRLPIDRAIVVNYGLPNDGAERLAQRLAKTRMRNPLGVNIVKTNDGLDGPECDDDAIIADYIYSIERTHRYCDYLTLNLSCPNARDGKDFFSLPHNIEKLLKQIAGLKIHLPVFLKVAPNPDLTSIDRLISDAEPFEFVQGFLFNLPTGKPDSLRLSTPRAVWEKMPGAVAGQPVSQLIDECIRAMYVRMPPGRFIIIGGGGVFTAEDAYRKIRLGASLVQIYTALIYEGPCLIKRIHQGLQSLLIRDGMKSISEAVGIDCG